MGDLIDRQAAIDALNKLKIYRPLDSDRYVISDCLNKIVNLPPTQPDENKYEYHYDHTDCIWYRPEVRNRCPVTCAQYRDGWNDAMNYIFRDGKGNRPYRRDKQYER